MDALLLTMKLPAAMTGDASGASTEPNVLPVVMLVVGVLMLGFILIYSIRNKIARRQAETPTPHERIAAIKANAGARDSIDGARVELADMARRLAAQLDVKAARLEQLIVQADDRIASLRRSASGDVTLPVPKLVPQEAPDESPGEDEPDDDAPIAARRIETGAPIDTLTAQVYEMADGGHDPVSIAQSLDEQIGKVELILALRESA